MGPAHLADPPKSKKWADHRRVINAIWFRTRTGVPWRDLPERYGPWGTAVSGEEIIASVDSTTVRAHSHAAGAAKKREEVREEPDWREALGRSRRGPATKIHLLASLLHRYHGRVHLPVWTDRLNGVAALLRKGIQRSSVAARVAAEPIGVPIAKLVLFTRGGEEGICPLEFVVARVGR